MTMTTADANAAAASPVVAPDLRIRLKIASARVMVPGRIAREMVEVAYGDLGGSAQFVAGRGIADDGSANDGSTVLDFRNLGTEPRAVLSLLEEALAVRDRASLESGHRVRLDVEFFTPPPGCTGWPQPKTDRGDFDWLPMNAGPVLGPPLVVFPEFGLLTLRRSYFASPRMPKPRIAALVADLADMTAARLAALSVGERVCNELMQEVLGEKLGGLPLADFLMGTMPRRAA